MPKQKDLKHLTRARMVKTGESYTAARAALLAKKARRIGGGEGDRPAPKALPPRELASVAGMSDAALKARTGCTWEGWVKALDHEGAAEWPHRQIAELVHTKFKIPGWWAQAVTVGYERIKGLREIGQRREGGFEASKSKTVAAPLERLRRAVTDARTRARWLPDVTPKLRRTTSPHSARLTWDDGTPVGFWFVAKGDARSQVTVTQQKLGTRVEVEARKAYWGERLGALADLLKEEALSR